MYMWESLCIVHLPSISGKQVGLDRNIRPTRKIIRKIPGVEVYLS